ncbi:phosphatase PAP2 family protein [Priestia megaterium]|uniref:phosphatase PAP2 family protein n=1 Tax=Priestia megaterium TaxID=1404 RepID=UPI002076AE13|nr:phosphatase PAP2 family protein [Priestia megaterium]MCU7740669.1 phosphatase PAP2 family protein [Priestia megaterium]MCU7746071.1 phosphatase PAP2 family protein [Priestia megaterium]USD16980.1 phosphatase PAP2 family protein [Priestia megaterium]
MVDSQTVSLYKKLIWMFGVAGLVFLGVLFVVSTDSFQGDHWLVSAIGDSTILQSASSIFHGFSFLASKVMIMVLLAVLLVFLFFKKDYIGMISAFLFILSGDIINKAVKDAVERGRPLEGIEGYSFPSGHAMMGILIYGLIIFFLTKHMNSQKVAKRYQLAITLIVLLIGVSRILLREHFLTDVLAGYSLGLMWLIVGIFFYTLVYAYVKPSAEKEFPKGM